MFGCQHNILNSYIILSHIVYLTLLFQIPVHCERDLNLGITVTDKNGRKFDNISSLEFDWSLSDSSLASLADELDYEITTAPSGRKLVNCKLH